MDTAAVRAVRSFNRTVTERVGALDEQYLGTGRPLGQARMLWEIGFDGADVRDLRQRLGLDSGHASRLLRALEREGLVEMEPGATDGRVRRARLTSTGKRERRKLDRLSDELATSMLEPLDTTQRERLQAAMAEVERLLRASLIEIEIADPTSEDARWCLEQYWDELARRFEGGFDRSQTIQIPQDELTPPGGLVLVARLRGRPVGSGSLRFHGRKPAHLKRMWISPDVRGAGLGRQAAARARAPRGPRRPRVGRPARDQPRPDGGDRALPRYRLPRGRRVQRREVRRPLVREAARTRLTLRFRP